MANYHRIDMNDSDEADGLSTEERLQRQLDDMPEGIRRQVRTTDELPADYRETVDAIHGAGGSKGTLAAKVSEDGRIDVDAAGSASENRVVMGKSADEVAMESHARKINADVDRLEALHDPKTGKPYAGREVEARELEAQIQRAHESFDFSRIRSHTNRDAEVIAHAKATEKRAAEIAEETDGRDGAFEATSKGARITYDS